VISLEFSVFSSLRRHPLLVLTALLAISTPYSFGQQTLGAITGTVTDSSGAVVADATVKAVNYATNLEVAAHTKTTGSFLIPDLPAGTYRVTITKEGFKTETHTEILVFGNRTTTLDTSLVVGSIGTTVEVNAVPLMNQVDTTIGLCRRYSNHRNDATGHRQLHATGNS
jgi:hypothetical protein